MSNSLALVRQPLNAQMLANWRLTGRASSESQSSLEKWRLEVRGRAGQTNKFWSSTSLGCRIGTNYHDYLLSSRITPGQTNQRHTA